MKPLALLLAILALAGCGSQQGEGCAAFSDRVTDTKVATDEASAREIASVCVTNMAGRLSRAPDASSTIAKSVIHMCAIPISKVTHMQSRDMAQFTASEIEQDFYQDALSEVLEIRAARCTDEFWKKK